MQPEQEANLECLGRKGFGIRIRKKRVTARAVLAAVDRLLNNKEAEQEALAFKETLKGWDGPAEAARFLREKFGPAVSP
jgi:UDP:flavonoid glycosyltransferase YjiC (YdhE family)